MNSKDDIWFQAKPMLSFCLAVTTAASARYFVLQPGPHGLEERPAWEPASRQFGNPLLPGMGQLAPAATSRSAWQRRMRYGPPATERRVPPGLLVALFAMPCAALPVLTRRASAPHRVSKPMFFSNSELERILF